MVVFVYLPTKAINAQEMKEGQNFLFSTLHHFLRKLLDENHCEGFSILNTSFALTCMVISYIHFHSIVKPKRKFLKRAFQ